MAMHTQAFCPDDRCCVPACAMMGHLNINAGGWLGTKMRGQGVSR